MPRDLTPHLDPATTALVTLEVQEKLLLPEQAMIPGLAAHAQEIGLIDRLGVLYDAARRVGVRIFYVTNPPGHGAIVDALAPHPADVSLTRSVGMPGFYAPPLDAYLRTRGVKTVIVTGVSANIAVNGTSIEAMNRGYRVIVPSDCVAGDPPSYVEQMLRFTLRNVALVAPVQGILDHWAGLPENRIAAPA